jgi:hypothetical protein
VSIGDLRSRIPKQLGGKTDLAIAEKPQTVLGTVGFMRSARGGKMQRAAWKAGRDWGR